MSAILAMLAKVPLWIYLLLIAWCVIGVQTWRVHHYRAQAVTLQSAVKTFKSAQKTNMATIAALQSANADWAQKCTAEVHEARQQAQLSVEADTKLQAQADANIKTLHKEAAHDVSVKAWLEQPVPAAAFDSLRKNGSTN